MVSGRSVLFKSDNQRWGGTGQGHRHDDSGGKSSRIITYPYLEVAALIKQTGSKLDPHQHSSSVNHGLGFFFSFFCQLRNHYFFLGKTEVYRWILSLVAELLIVR